MDFGETGAFPYEAFVDQDVVDVVAVGAGEA